MNDHNNYDISPGGGRVLIKLIKMELLIIGNKKLVEPYL